MEHMQFESGIPSEPTSEPSKSESDKGKKKKRVVLPPSFVVNEPQAEKTTEQPKAPGLKLEELLRAESKPGKIEPLQSESTEEKTSEKPETEVSGEDDPTVETLDDEERQYAAEQYVAEALPEATTKAEQSEPASAEQLAAVADEAFLHELQERLGDDEVTPEQAIDEAYEVVAETLVAEGSAEAATENESRFAYEQPTTKAPQEQADDQPPASTSGATPPPPRPPSTPAAFASAGRPQPGDNFRTVPSEAATLSADTFDSLDMARAERRGAGRGLLVGGILGYLIGRRRGRIKTEKRLVPIQQKLEKQVTDLHEKIATKEQKIRALAAGKAETTKTANQRYETIQRLRSEHAQPTPQEAVTNPAMAPRPEQIRPQEPTPETVEEMTEAGLLALAETLMVDHRPLRELYETNQLDQKSLRRIVREHLRGGNVHEVVAREMVAKQLPFEQDPRLRRQAANSGQAHLQAGAAYAASQTTRHDPTMLPSPAPHELLTQETATTHRQHEERRTAAIAITVLVAIAVALAVVFALS